MKSFKRFKFCSPPSDKLGAELRLDLAVSAAEACSSESSAVKGLGRTPRAKCPFKSFQVLSS